MNGYSEINMAVNQPPIKKDTVEASWDLEVTQSINQLEQRLNQLLQSIRDADDLNDLKRRIRNQ